MTRGYLGIDVGGTASRWAVIDDAGEVLARGNAPGATGHLFAAAERQRFADAIGELASAAPTGIAAAHCGLTGLGPLAEQEANAIISGRLGIPLDAVSSSDDVDLAFRAVFAPGEGHLVAAGTGSIGLHITAAGDPIRVGGRGLLIDDGGSGTWIALTGLNLLYRRIDETGSPGDAAALAEAFYDAIGGSGWDAVRSFIYGSDRGRIGTLAQAVAAAANAGDPLALGILDDAASELARLARALMGRTARQPVAFIGGVISLHPAFRRGLIAALPDTQISFPQVDAALHAARMARQHVARI
jgi:glucosamine kinase